MNDDTPDAKLSPEDERRLFWDQAADNRVLIDSLRIIADALSDMQLALLSARLSDAADSFDEFATTAEAMILESPLATQSNPETGRAA